MAIALEFVNVIIRKSTVEATYPGGLDGFVRQDLPNYLEDEHLLRVGFMSTNDAFRFVDEMCDSGVCRCDDSAHDVVAVVWHDSSAPDWLSVGPYEGRAACWLREEAPGRLVELDPGTLFRCNEFATIEALIDAIHHIGASVLRRESSEHAGVVLLECERGAARVIVEVFLDSNDGRPVGIWERRDLVRRESIAVDVALLRDLNRALESENR